MAGAVQPRLGVDMPPPQSANPVPHLYLVNPWQFCSELSENALHSASGTCLAVMDELLAAASVFAMEADSESGDDLGPDEDPIQSGSHVLRERSAQPGVANMSGMDVDDAPKESEDVAKQVIPATLHTASTRCAPPLASFCSHAFCALNHRAAGLS